MGQVAGGGTEGAEVDRKHVVGSEPNCCKGGTTGGELYDEVRRGARRVRSVVSSAALEVAERNEINWKVLGIVSSIHVVVGRKTIQLAFVREEDVAADTSDEEWLSER